MHWSRLLILLLVAASCQPATTLADDPIAVLNSILEAIRTIDRVDYAERINASMRRDIQPKDNFFAAIFPLVPMADLDETDGEWVQRYCDEIGAVHPVSELVKICEQSIESIPIEGTQKELDAECQRALEQPWRSADFPLAEAWLVVNEPGWMRVIQATECCCAYRPLIPPRGKPLMFSALPDLQLSRTMARIGAMRVQRSLGSADLDQARRDLVALNRLSCHVGQAGCLIQLLVSNSIHAVIQGPQATYLLHPGMTEDKRLSYLALIEALPAPRSHIEVFNEGECWSTVDAIDFYRRGIFDPQTVDEFTADEETRHRQVLYQLLIAAVVDWPYVIAGLKEAYDLVVEAMREPQGPERIHHLKLAEQTLRGFLGSSGTDVDAANSALRAEIRRLIREYDRQGRSAAVGRMLAARLMPAFDQIDRAERHRKSRKGFLPVLVALIQSHDHTGEWPSTTEGLHLPDGRAVGIDDLCSQPYRVRVNGDLLTLYSLGLDGIDQGGIFGAMEGGANADDLAFTIRLSPTNRTDSNLKASTHDDKSPKVSDQSNFLQYFGFGLIVIVGAIVVRWIHHRRS